MRPFLFVCVFFFFSSRRRHTRWPRDWSSDVCSSDLWQEEKRPVNAEFYSEDSARRNRPASHLQGLSLTLLPFYILDDCRAGRADLAASKVLRPAIEIYACDCWKTWQPAFALVTRRRYSAYF